jgi:glyoxylase-like metal-dependent hydrolase (beta-lactamase superfamily II)
VVERRHQGDRGIQALTGGQFGEARTTVVEPHGLVVGRGAPPPDWNVRPTNRLANGVYQLGVFIMMELSHSFRVGELRCIALLDGTHVYHADQYFLDAPAERRGAALARHKIAAPEQIPSPFTCLAVATGESAWTLLDAGLGLGLSPAAGHLPQNLLAAGVRPEDVQTIVLTHGHPDHIGGLTQAGGALTYPDARYVMLRDDWTYWTSETELARMPPVFSEAARRNLVPIRDRIELPERETEIAPGVHLVPAPGHTPGHAVVHLASAGESLLFISDTVLHPIHLEEPEWRTSYDMDHAMAAASKRKVFDRAAEERALVLAFHFHPFPSLGRVERRGDGWRWSPAV